MAEPSLPETGDSEELNSEPPYDGSLFDDVAATIEDGKTYVEAELAYQKSRASFAANRSKQALGLGMAAFAMLHTALIALVVGLIFALSPSLTPVGATAAVFGGLILGGAFLMWAAVKRARTIKQAFGDETK